jgi:hypothetical protein
MTAEGGSYVRETTPLGVFVCGLDMELSCLNTNERDHYMCRFVSSQEGAAKPGQSKANQLD